MSDTATRLAVAILASASVAGLIASLTGPRWETTPPRYRRIGLAFCGPLLVIVAGVWYAAVNEFPLNPFIYAQGVTLAVLVGCVLYGIRSGK